MISLYSFLWTVFISSILIVCLYFLRKNTAFLLHFGITPLMLLFICCVIRMMVPVEIPQIQFQITDDQFFADLMYPYASSPMQAFMIPLAVWIGIGCVLVIRFVIKVYSLHRYLNRLTYVECEEACSVLAKIDQSGRLRLRGTLELSMPIVAGLIHPTIYLPKLNYTEEQLHYIILHEYTHWKNKDLWVKFFINFFCIIFWWNPLVYLLKKDLSQILELKCDATLTKNLTEYEKLDYLNTLLYALQNSSQDKGVLVEGIYTAELVDSVDCSSTKQRFKYVTNKKPSLAKKVLYEVGYITLLFGLVAFSYSVIIQPSYLPEKEDWYEPGVDFFATSDNSYLIQKDDTTYLLYCDGELWEEVSKEDVDAGLYSYIPIKEKGEKLP